MISIGIYQKVVIDMGENKQYTVGELIKELEEIPKNFKVELSVNYDNCDHIQPLKKIYVPNPETEYIDWITLRGK